MSAEPKIELTPRPSKAVLSAVEKAVYDFELIKAGDRVAVAISGGKDSLLLIAAIRQLSLRADLPFDWTVIHLDQKQPGFDHAGFKAMCDRMGVECTVIEEDTHSVVQAALKPGQIPCAICSRMRRGILNTWCEENGYNRLALGHHLDDAIETFFLNLMYRRQLEPLKPLTPSDNGFVDTIRPLILVEESKVIGWVREYDLAPVACPVCDTYPASKRRDIKHMLTSFEAMHGDFRASVRDALYSS